ncbi:MAG: hypothetical protein K0S93_877 [Nitrososphaeraceae archaeon]|jgi:hypothetical protein|nr:hypothetical protein [Nitrososphaeraceae archaeon]
MKKEMLGIFVLQKLSFSLVGIVIVILIKDVRH